MRMHSVSKMYTNFIYDIYINLFQKRYLANGLARKTKNSFTVISHYNEKDGRGYAEDISMDGKEKLQKFSKKIPEAENMTELVLD